MKQLSTAVNMMMCMYCCRMCMVSCAPISDLSSASRRAA